MSRQIAIVGAGEDKVSIAKAFAEQGVHDIEIVTPEEAERLSNSPFDKMQDEGYFKIEMSPVLKYDTGKEFVCKGKHQYREVRVNDGNFIKVSWVCQCGRKTTD